MFQHSYNCAHYLLVVGVDPDCIVNSVSDTRYYMCGVMLQALYLT